MVNPPDEARDNYISPLEPGSNQAELEATNDSIEALLPQLDFHATSELTEARQAVLAALSEQTADSSRLQAAWTEYAIISEQIVDNIEITPQDIEAREKIQLAFLIHKALIFREAQQIPRYVEELDYAETYADAKGFYDVASSLERQLDVATNTSPLSPEILIVKLKGEISEMDRVRLRDLSEAGVNLEDLTDAAGVVLQNEQADPEEIFDQLGIPKPKA
ncbi:hypothetical protein H7X69_00530 [Candidatus Saccharibacteria bacterium]|nr:hypothetical protein [Candidatus Saccharibacteria bacterium]